MVTLGFISVRLFNRPGWQKRPERFRSHPETCFRSENESFCWLARSENEEYLDSILSLSDAARQQKGRSQQKLGFWDGFYLPYRAGISRAIFRVTCSDRSSLVAENLALRPGTHHWLFGWEETGGEWCLVAASAHIHLFRAFSNHKRQ